MNLKEHLQENGKTDSWINLANQFQVKGTNKQKSDYVRRLYRKISLQKKIDNFNKVPDVRGTQITYLSTNNGDAVYSMPITPKDSLIRYKVGNFPNQSIDWNRTIQPVIVPNTPAWNNQLEDRQKKDWEEFEKWKASKEYVEPTRKDGIHLVIGCMHVPFHNAKLLEKLLTFIDNNKSKIIGLHFIGDYLDLKSLSSHDEKNIDNSGWTLGKEYEAGNRVLDLFESHLYPVKIQKTFLYGNHEDRYFRYVNNIKNYKTADAIQSPAQALRLKERGYQILENWKEDYVQIGKYQLLHGIFCTINPSKSHIDKLRQSCLFAHTHRVGQHYEGDLHGVNIGSMAELNSSAFSYMSRLERTTWKNAFGIINIHGNQSHAEVVVCENNGFFYGGVKY